MPDGTTYSYAYDDNDNVTRISIPGVGDISYPSYTLNRPDNVIFPGGSQQTYTYDDLMRIERIVSSASGLDYQYTSFDNVHNILTKVTEHGMYDYGYDDLYRLTSATNPTPDNEAYTYDGVGNRETVSGVSGSITHNANNELTVYGDISYEYDANGNMTRKSVGTAAVNYIYNVENRLIRVEDELSGLVIADYYYDPFGRRLWKEVDGTKTYFLYADEGLVAEYDENGTEIKTYGYQPDSTWTTDPLWLKQGNDYYFYQNDHLGTPQKLIDTAGNVVWEAQYNAFGDAQVAVNTIENNLRFPGQYADAETGLQYNFQRYYDPGSGRYRKEDPIGFDSGDINLYEYGRGNPINAFDPQGLRIYFQHPRELELIPRIMRNQNPPFEKGAGMLEQWFSRPARRIVDTPPDVITHKDPPHITMDWILGFPRARTVYEKMLAEKVYKNSAAKNWIREDPKRFGIQPGNPSAFGHFPLKFPEFHEHYVNYREVGNLWTDPFDDLLAALGRFAFHVVITKGVKYGGFFQKACLRVDEIGIYMRDSFDFEGAQPLGVWNPDTNYGGKFNKFKGTMVGNASFQRYRIWFNRGGDFLIFSDIHQIPLDPPEWIYLGVP